MKYFTVNLKFGVVCIVVRLFGIGRGLWSDIFEGPDAEIRKKKLKAIEQKTEMDLT